MLKWLHAWFARGEKTKSPKCETPQPQLRFVAKKLKYGFKPNIYDGTDLVWQGTDYHKTAKLAEASAKKYFCKAWELID